MITTSEQVTFFACIFFCNLNIPPTKLHPVGICSSGLFMYCSHLYTRHFTSSPHAYVCIDKLSERVVSAENFILLYVYFLCLSKLTPLFFATYTFYFSLHRS